LQQTGKAEVDALLKDFWAMLSRHDQRSEALQLLGLSDPVSNGAIRRRYRELVMRHHPDRGGDTQHQQLLNAAIATLLPGKT
jgi:DnaJ-class molecular chaperone